MAEKISKPIISIPVTLKRRATKRLEKLRAKELEEQFSKYNKGDRTIPALIQCRRQELNHYKNQTYSPYKRLPLASEHWLSRSTIGDFFSFVPHRGPSATTWYKYMPSVMENFQFAEGDIIKSQKSDKPTFEELNLDTRLIKVLSSLGMKNPTNIQFEALPFLLAGKNSLIASETGNGKTLAFLLPIIQRILNNPSPNRKYMSPLAVIATPGRELAAQIRDVAESLCADFGINVKFVTGSSVSSKVESMKRENVDILIGSVGGLSKMFTGQLFFADHVDMVVLDEIDSMVDDSFKGVTGNLLASLRQKIDQQMIFSGATFPKNLDSSLGHLVNTEGFEIIQTRFLHRIMPHVYQKFIKAPKVGRIDYLLEVIEKDVEKKRQVLIFANKGSTSAFISHALKEVGIDALHFAGNNLNPRVRRHNLHQFLDQKCNVLCCTDLVSRGIDTRNINHVVNYDFPSNMSDYLHRVGRIGRVGSTVSGGKVTNLVCGKISVALVQELEKSVRLNKEIPNIESNVKSLFNKVDQEID